jgi:hypothetical protein
MASFASLARADTKSGTKSGFFLLLHLLVMMVNQYQLNYYTFIIVVRIVIIRQLHYDLLRIYRGNTLLGSSCLLYTVKNVRRKNVFARKYAKCAGMYASLRVSSKCRMCKNRWFAEMIDVQYTAPPIKLMVNVS